MNYQSKIVCLFGMIFFAPLALSNTTQITDSRFERRFNKEIPVQTDFGGKDRIEVEILRDFGFVFVDVLVNSQGPFRFLVDTGSDTSILSREVVEALQIQPIKTHKKIFQTGRSEAEIDTFLYNIDDLKMGELVFKKVPFITSNTANDDFLILKELNIKGIIGANLFNDIVLTLDLPRKKMLFMQTQDKGGDSKNNIKFQHENYLPIIKTTFLSSHGTTDYDFLIDTGYTGFVQMPICFSYQNKNENAITSYDVFNASNTGFLSELHGSWMIGNKKIENPTVKYLMGTCEKPLRWGLIGTRFLEHHVVTIDQQRRQVTVN